MKSITPRKLTYATDEMWIATHTHPRLIDPYISKFLDMVAYLNIYGWRNFLASLYAEQLRFQDRSRYYIPGDYNVSDFSYNPWKKKK